MSKPKPKVQFNEDLTQSFGILFNEKPAINFAKSFRDVTTDYVIDNIQEENVLNYFQIIKELVKQTTEEFKGTSSCKLKLIITTEFASYVPKDVDGEEKIITVFFNHSFHNIHTLDNFELIYKNIIDQFETWVDEFQENGSGFVFKKIISTTIRLSKINPLRAGSYIKHELGNCKSILNIKNTNDNKCFVWSILAKLFPPNNKNRNTTRVSNYTPYESRLNLSGLEFPMSKDNISKFEKLNPNLSIYVFALEDPKTISSLYPLYMSKNSGENTITVDLLFIEKEGNSHYCLIKSLESLFHVKNNQAFICRNCLILFSTSNALANHQEICLNHNFCKVKLMGGKLNFKNSHFKSKLPIVFYADFETIAIPISPLETSTNSTQQIPLLKQEVISYGIYIKSDYPNLVLSQYLTYTGENADKHFVDTLMDFYTTISKKITYYSKANKTVKLNPKQKLDFETATRCYFCNKEFATELKIREHNHFNGKYRGASCQSCNTKEGKSSKIIPLFFHNGSGFDFHFIVEHLAAFEDKYNKMTVLAKTSEDYISITYGSYYRKLVFLDSYRFLQKGLASVGESLATEDFKILSTEFPTSTNLLKRKGVYPYEYISGLEVLNETQLPPIEKFFSTLKQETISEGEYEYAKEVWKVFNCKTLLDYHNLYLKADVLILADAFEKFREFFLTNHAIDPCYCFSAPGLTWQCGFKYTKAELDYLEDYDMLLMIEKGIRGGYSGVLGERYVKANNKYLEDFDSQKPSNFLLYLDANNLYAWAMSQALPTGDFKWEEPTTYNWRNPPNERGCIVECDLEYTVASKFLTYKFPLAPEKLKVQTEDLSKLQLHYLEVEDRGVCNVEKLILNLRDKDKYVIHYELLKYYEKLGLRLKKIHRIISFQQEPWLKQYIDFNTTERTKAKTNFEKDLWKLMNNAFYGKTMENIRGRVSIKLLNNGEEAKKMFSKPTYKDHIIFNENLLAVLNNIPSVKFDKPIYLGMCILDYSKLLMYKFYYETINIVWPNNQIIGYDTDSYFLDIKTEDVYRDLKEIEHNLDLSDYPSTSSLHSNKNKKIIGKFKDELNGKLMSEIVFLRSKAYSFKVANEPKETKKLKGISQQTIAKDVSFEDYKSAIFNPYIKPNYNKMYTMNSNKHNIYVYELTKKSISPFDDKRIILEDGIRTLPFGSDELYFI